MSSSGRPTSRDRQAGPRRAAQPVSDVPELQSMARGRHFAPDSLDDASLDSSATSHRRSGLDDTSPVRGSRFLSETPPIGAKSAPKPGRFRFTLDAEPEVDTVKYVNIQADSSSKSIANDRIVTGAPTAPPTPISPADTELTESLDTASTKFESAPEALTASRTGSQAVLPEAPELVSMTTGENQTEHPRPLKIVGTSTSTASVSSSVPHTFPPVIKTSSLGHPRSNRNSMNLKILAVLVVMLIVFGFAMSRVGHNGDTTPTPTVNRFQTLELPAKVDTYELDPASPSPSISTAGVSFRSTLASYYVPSGQKKLLVSLSQPVTDTGELLYNLDFNSLGANGEVVCGTSSSENFNACAYIQDATGLVIVGSSGQTTKELQNIVQAFITELA